MYDAMNGWLDIETWHTGHPNDRERFFRGLDKIIDSHNFNADEMREHCRRRVGLAIEDHESDLAKVIDRHAQEAWAVKEYLAIRRRRPLDNEQ
ncbi:hypothetical protein [Parvibaculum sp.]|uniref:hypothetical protein n=1 Tax=Parvibaculum sp. TaxID=2024848 RepID=UPI00261DB3D7|nr:hypothetical protein [Parvibaculum sp.]MCW5727266.1 hypothetical protein [Parvibaculum sp.]